MITPAHLFHTLEALPVDGVATWTQSSRTVVVRRISARHWGDPMFLWEGSEGTFRFQAVAPSVAVAAAQCLRWLVSGERPVTAQPLSRASAQRS